MKKPSIAQLRALGDIARGRPVAGNDEGWVTPPCPRPTLNALKRAGLVEREGYNQHGVMCGPGLCRLTDAGQAALSSGAAT